LGRAGLACAAVAGGWFLLWPVWPAAVGLGDVRMFALASGIVGYQSWIAVLVAMGPGLIAGTIIAAWITG